jgi:large subunit ribosomal protein L24
MQGTKNPGKQRKMHFNAPAHKRHKLMTAPLSAELLAQRGVKAMPVRKGDTVRIMRGDHKGFDGKISRVDLKHFRVYLEGLTREKVDGTTVFVALHPSKIMIKTLNLDDKVRKAVLDRKKPIMKKGAKAAKKTTPKVAVENKSVEEAAIPDPETTKVEQAEKEMDVSNSTPSNETTPETQGGN